MDPINTQLTSLPGEVNAHYSPELSFYVSEYSGDIMPLSLLDDEYDEPLDGFVLSVPINVPTPMSIEATQQNPTPPK
jgi:hypothetical protein